MQSVLSLDQVSWRRDGTLILSDITWTVRAGEHWALIGVNGSGKTSLLQIVTGYHWPTTGTVEVLGQRFGKCDLRELRRSIGWVSTAVQERLTAAHPDERTLDVVLSGKFASIGIYDDADEDDWARARQLLGELGLADRAKQPFRLLSQGEKQRAIVARAFMAQPRLLILDEPCTGLDIPAREMLLRSLDRLTAQPDAPTLLYVTHHVEEVLPVFTHALLLQSGRILAAGPKQEVLTSERLTEAFGVPVRVHWHSGRPWVTVV